VGIAIGITVVILGQLATNVDVQGQTTVRVNNETIVANLVSNLTTSTYKYGFAKVANVDRGVTFLYFTNGTKVQNIDAVNFTTNSNGYFYLNNATAGSYLYNGTSINVTYTYQRSGVAYLGVNSTITSVNNITDWLPIIVLVIVAALILGLIVKGFIGRQE
jgi:hypothetical protein